MPRPVAPSLSERYQDATKYTPQSIQGHPGLDFSSQPSAFKDWYQARRVVLAAGPDAPADPEPGALDADRLGRLLYHTYGVTLVREFPGMSMHYRAAPSAGGLYPTELYVAVRDIEGIPDGIFAYDARDHSLVVCWEGDFTADLARYTFDHPAIAKARAVLIGTGIYERSAWRYGDRAYRRVLLDTGHVFGNAVLAAVPDGQRIVPVPYFLDSGIADLLLLDSSAEGALLLAAVLDDPVDSKVLAQQPVRSSIERDAIDPDEGGWIPVLHAAGQLDGEGDSQDVPAPSGHAAPLSEPIPLSSDALAGGRCVHAAIRRRRSTRIFEPGDIPLEAVGRILAHAYPQPDAPDPAARLLPDLLDTYVVASGVRDLDAGVYRYDTDAHTLTLVHRGNARDALHRCCLWQELGRDCSFAVVHTIDLPRAVAALGERVYRTAHLDAGMIGQRLNMAAIRLGYGASGIGGFFDEFLNALLLLAPNHAVAYITTIGAPA